MKTFSVTFKPLALLYRTLTDKLLTFRARPVKFLLPSKAILPPRRRVCSVEIINAPRDVLMTRLGPPCYYNYNALCRCIFLFALPFIFLKLHFGSYKSGGEKFPLIEDNHYNARSWERIARFPVQCIRIALPVELLCPPPLDLCFTPSFFFAFYFFLPRSSVRFGTSSAVENS